MGTLYVVATPIGNLEDITLRALRVLAEVDLVFAEDTRRTRILLDRHAVSARPISLHAHNEASRIAQALATLEGEGSVALVSDAGTPLVSDPGERLVKAAIAEGHRVEALPGASAALVALAVSGLPALPVVLLGFLPRRVGARRDLLASYRDRPETLVIFESPRRVAATLLELSEAFGERRACAARELTKLHEEVRRGSLRELAAGFEGGARGELTLVVEGQGAPVHRGQDEAEAVGREPTDEELAEEIRRLLEAGRRPREIAAALSRSTGIPRRVVYARAVAVKEQL
jgi:16S rRNA (cytidine1402-2'-O)-methyltransferase